MWNKSNLLTLRREESIPQLDQICRQQSFSREIHPKLTFRKKLSGQLKILSKLIGWGQSLTQRVSYTTYGNNSIKSKHFYTKTGKREVLAEPSALGPPNKKISFIEAHSFAQKPGNQ